MYFYKNMTTPILRFITPISLLNEEMPVVRYVSKCRKPWIYSTLETLAIQSIVVVVASCKKSLQVFLKVGK